MLDQSETTHFRTCPLCEAMCGLAITVRGDEIMSIRGDVDDPFSRGHICPKGAALQDIHTDPDRLRHPVRRTASGWERIDWDTAFAEVVAGLKAVQARHGSDAVGVYQGNPSVHNLGTSLFSPAFVKSLKTKNRFSATSVDQLPHQFVAYLMYGHQLLLPIPDLDRTDFLLILGANPAVSNGSLMTAPDVKRRLKAIRQRGGKVVVIDPRRNETAALADEHHFIRPGSDALLVLALLNTILGEGLANPDRLAAFTDGLERIEPLVAEFTPEQVAPQVGIAAATIRQLARDFAQAPSAVCYGRIGVSVQAFGAVTQWLIQVLNIVTGNLDRAGGAMLTTPAIDTLAVGGKGNFARWTSRVRGLPEFSGELPVVTLAEEIATPGAGQIRAMVTSAGNPVLSTPNGRQLDAALAGLDFMVSIDFYINETTRHATIILPPTSPLEHDHYDLVFHVLAIRNTTRYDPALFEAPADTRHDWEIFQTLAGLMTATADSPPRKPIPPAAMVERGLWAGPYKLALETLADHPHGIDLGPLEPRLPERLFSADKRITLAPELLVADLARVRAELLHAPDSGPALRLIGRRQLRSNNSWMHNSQRLVKGEDRCTLLISPHDAAQRNISAGQQVQVRSRVGNVAAAAEISDTLMPGVVCLPHGWGHGLEGVLLGVAQAHAGVSINDLTDELAIDPVCGNAALNGVPVEVEALG
ncbi:MAG: molybdopterin-dependent oxidoreductase [Herpetosiphonaceae bacterium]|nr:molybdopterin-dependent oxidoreductase [Herpetosiphonaceae bacterium]